MLSQEFKNALRTAFIVSQARDLDLHQVWSSKEDNAQSDDTIQKIWEQSRLQLLQAILNESALDKTKMFYLGNLIARYALAQLSPVRKSGSVAGHHLTTGRSFISSLYTMAASFTREATNYINFSSAEINENVVQWSFDDAPPLLTLDIWKQASDSLTYFGRRGSWESGFEFNTDAWEELIKKAPTAIAKQLVRRAHKLVKRRANERYFDQKVIQNAHAIANPVKNASRYRKKGLPQKLLALNLDLAILEYVQKGLISASEAQTLPNRHEIAQAYRDYGHKLQQIIGRATKQERRILMARVDYCVQTAAELADANDLAYSRELRDIIHYARTKEWVNTPTDLEGISFYKSDFYEKCGLAANFERWPSRKILGLKARFNDVFHLEDLKQIALDHSLCVKMPEPSVLSAWKKQKVVFVGWTASNNSLKPIQPNIPVSVHQPEGRLLLITNASGQANAINNFIAERHERYRAASVQNIVLGS